MRVKPFAALRPPKNLVTEVAAPPYDVLNSEEAKAMAGEKSLLHITKPEIDFDPMPDEHAPQVYDRAVENFRLWQQRGWLVRDQKPCYYIYAQTMGSRTQYGFVLCAHAQDYVEGRIKKHELTRKDKEDDRMVHVEIQSANIEPVFFAFKHQSELEDIIDRTVKGPSEYSFTDENGFGHELWVISDDALIERISELFTEKVDAFYIADGHHRSAAAARVGAERAKKNPAHNGNEEYNYFMAVCFQASQLTILDYNRVVKDLNGLSSEEFLDKLSANFCVEDKGTDIFKPAELHEFSLYLDGHWYSLKAKQGTYDNNDPIGVLDVDISSRLILDEILDIKDLRSSQRIDFVGGLRGLAELKRRVDSGEMRAALALYPVSMQQIMDIADSGKIMPPKATWFEPKLRSGLVIHKLS